MPELHGWIFDDEIIAGEENTTPFYMYGHEGNDRLSGGNGSDLIDGGTGADDMLGWLGNDTYVVDNVGDTIIEADLHYGAAEYDEDVLAYSSQGDIVYASISFTLPDARDIETFGNFVINGVENLSLITGAGAINGTGNELGNVIHGNGSANTLAGRDGHDLLIGHGGNDTLRGGDHNDELYGSEDNDTLEGDAGNDMLDGGTGSDEMLGGSGDDIYYVDNIGDRAIELTSPGIDTVLTSVTFTLGGNVEDLGMLAGAVDATGNALDNTMTGNGSDNEIRGLDGDDLLKGGGGGDVLRGGDHEDELHGQGGDDDLRGDGGDDQMFGGRDNDTYAVNSAGDEVKEIANEGIDLVNVSGLDFYALTANVENLTLLSGINGTGNGLQNRIIGNIADNTLDGAGGADTMEGRLGDDTYVVDNAADVVVELNGQGDDTVLASVSYTLAGVSVERLATTNDAGTAGINLTGNGINNAIIGNNGGNILNGRGGSDGMDGRGGVDTASYENNAWRVVVMLGVNGAPGLGYEFGLVNGAEVLLSLDTLLNIENVRGTGFNDMLIGNEAVNELRGLGGSDTYVVQNAGDTIIESGGQGNDEVRASVSYTLTAGADVETLRTTDDAGTTAINLTGNANNNVVIGNNGDNTLNGGGGSSDELQGRGGSDTYVVTSANVAIIEAGGQGSDTVRSSVSYVLTAGADVELFTTTNDAGTAAINLTGNFASNEVRGNNGNNVLAGGDGRDTLTGLGGQDSFLFNTALDAANNVDQITDFNQAADTIQLDDAVFSAFTPGAVAGDRVFFVGFGVQDGNDNLIYDRAAGTLFYDSDGAGGAAAILFAELTNQAALNTLDFVIV
jgi:trimeric autotransporter adhesin